MALPWARRSNAPAPTTILAERGSGYNMPHWNVDGNDVDTVIREFGKAVDRARAGEGPSYIVANTYRFRGHSMSDAMKYRSKDELEKARSRDPIRSIARGSAKPA